MFEFGLVRAAERIAVHEKARIEGVPLNIRLPDAPREVRREHVIARNVGAGPFTQAVPAEVFELASDA